MEAPTICKVSPMSASAQASSLRRYPYGERAQEAQRTLLSDELPGRSRSRCSFDLRLRLRPLRYHIAAVGNTGDWYPCKAGTATGISRRQILALTARGSAHMSAPLSCSRLSGCISLTRGLERRRPEAPAHNYPDLKVETSLVEAGGTMGSASHSWIYLIYDRFVRSTAVRDPHDAM